MLLLRTNSRLCLYDKAFIDRLDVIGDRCREGRAMGHFTSLALDVLQGKPRDEDLLLQRDRLLLLDDLRGLVGCLGLNCRPA